MYRIDTDVSIQIQKIYICVLIYLGELLLFLWSVLRVLLLGTVRFTIDGNLFDKTENPKAITYHRTISERTEIN